MPKTLLRALTLIAGAALVAGALLPLSVSQSVGAEPLAPGIEPDFVLSPGESKSIVSTNVNVGDPALLHPPADCRSAEFGNVCDVYRIKLNRDVSPDATNVVFFTVEFEPLFRTPGLPVAVAGLASVPIGDLEVYVFDEADHYLGENYPGGGGDVGFVLDTLAQTPAGAAEPPLRDLLLGSDPGDVEDVPPGGTGFDIPIRGGFTAKKDTYDLVVGAGAGANLGYTLHVRLSNEKFGTPFEDLGAPLTAIDGPPSGGFESPPLAPNSGGATTVEGLPTLDIAPDSAIAGIGSGLTEQFNAPLLTAIGRTRAVNANAKPPSSLALLIGLVALPLAGAGAGFALMRRRRAALI